MKKMTQSYQKWCNNMGNRTNDDAIGQKMTQFCFAGIILK